MVHVINDDDERRVADTLRRALRIAEAVFKTSDPLVTFEIHDRLVARAHCCRLKLGEEEDDEPRWT